MCAITNVAAVLGKESETMNKAFEKILERLDSHIEDAKSEGDFSYIKPFEIAKIAVQEVAEEYNGGWIPCSEKLPEKNGMYLCTQNTYDLATNKNIIRVSTELVEFYDGKWRRAKNLVITHWQPLPEPFKERD